VAAWLITAVGGMTSGLAARDLRLAALALLAGGVACGVAMGFALTAAGRTPAGGRPVPVGPGPAPSLAEPRSLMNPPPPTPPPPLAPPRAAPASGDRASGGGPLAGAPSAEGPAGEGPAGEGPSGEPAPRVWWRAPHSPASSWDDTSEEWLRSLRGPAIQQPPPHSAE
jgi:hypothetical protein